MITWRWMRKEPCGCILIESFRMMVVQSLLSLLQIYLGIGREKLQEMTNKESINRNIGLTFDFIKQVIENPETIDKIEDNSTIEFLQKDYPERESPKQIIADKYIRVRRKFELI